MPQVIITFKSLKPSYTCEIMWEKLSLPSQVWEVTCLDIVWKNNIFVKNVRILLNIQVILEFIDCATLNRDVEEVEPVC